MSLPRKASAASVRSPLHTRRKTCGRASAARDAHRSREAAVPVVRQRPPRAATLEATGPASSSQTSRPRAFRESRSLLERDLLVLRRRPLRERREVDVPEPALVAGEHHPLDHPEGDRPVGLYVDEAPERPVGLVLMNLL